MFFPLCQDTTVWFSVRSLMLMMIKEMIFPHLLQVEKHKQLTTAIKQAQKAYALFVCICIVETNGPIKSAGIFMYCI